MSVGTVQQSGAGMVQSRAEQLKQSVLRDLRHAAEQLVGMTFFQTLMQTAENTALKGKYGHGGRGEEIFREQMNTIFA